MSLNLQEQETGAQLVKPDIDPSGGEVYSDFSGCFLPAEDAMPAFMEAEEENWLNV
jgi:hypothetical protein